MKAIFFSLDHLSVSYALAAAELDLEVVIFSQRTSVIEGSLLDSHILEFFDESVHQKLTEVHRPQIKLTKETKLFSKADLIFIAIDVDVDQDLIADTRKLSDALRVVSEAVGDQKRSVVVHSQLPIGYSLFAQNEFSNIQIIYWVETLIFGKGYSRALNPERIILGYDRQLDLPNPLSLYISKFKCDIVKMSLQSAEITKIAINCYLAAQITMTNSLAAITRRVGGDWQDVRIALALDRRIGEKAYLEPGLGISGTNIPRDINGVRNLEFDAKISLIFDEIVQFSQACQVEPLSISQSILQKNEISKGNLKILFLGISYTVGSNCWRNSPFIQMARLCKEKYYPDAQLYAWDRDINTLDSRIILDCSLVQIIVDFTDSSFKEFDLVFVTKPNMNVQTLKSLLDKGDLIFHRIIDPFDYFVSENLNTFGSLRRQ